MLFWAGSSRAIRQSAFLFVGDSPCRKRARLHTTDTFQPQRVGRAPRTSVDAALAGQNTLLAAKRIWWSNHRLVRLQICWISRIVQTSDTPTQFLGLPLVYPNQQHDVEPRLPLEQVVFEEEYQEQTWGYWSLTVCRLVRGRDATTTWSQCCGHSVSLNQARQKSRTKELVESENISAQYCHCRTSQCGKSTLFNHVQERLNQKMSEG